VETARGRADSGNAPGPEPNLEDEGLRILNPQPRLDERLSGRELLVRPTVREHLVHGLLYCKCQNLI
jgi:hypothetical protein